MLAKELGQLLASSLSGGRRRTGHVQRRPAVLIAQINVGSGRQNHFREFTDVYPPVRQVRQVVQGRQAIIILGVHICPMVNQKFDEILVGSYGGAN